ncbi:MAG: N-acetyltransferase, partial [Gammaproteobacteria bacterium]|nr:N-acetyltransferase [Gammaproteobacteria bacterium]
MDMEIKIREAVLSDAGEIQNCVQEAYQHYIERIGKPPGPMLDDYAEVIKSHLVYVAESDGVVGVLVLMKSENRFLLDNVAVDPS